MKRPIHAKAACGAVTPKVTSKISGRAAQAGETPDEPLAAEVTPVVVRGRRQCRTGRGRHQAAIARRARRGDGSCPGRCARSGRHDLTPLSAASRCPNVGGTERLVPLSPWTRWRVVTFAAQLPDIDSRRLELASVGNPFAWPPHERAFTG